MVSTNFVSLQEELWEQYKQVLAASCPSQMDIHRSRNDGIPFDAKITTERFVREHHVQALCMWLISACHIAVLGSISIFLKDSGASIRPRGAEFLQVRTIEKDV